MKKYQDKNKEKIKIKNKKYREKNKEKIKIKNKKYRENNKEGIKKYYMENKDKINKREKKHYENNKDKIKIREKKYQEKNKEKIKNRKKIYYEDNKDEIKIKNKKYHEENKKAICIICGKPAHIKYCSDKCFGIGNKGENNCNWKGGITPINMKIRGSKEYKLWRTAVFERDDYTCIWCGQVGGELNADHIKPFSLFPELRFAIDNGRTLCEPCHRTTDTYGGKSRNIEK